MNPPQNINNHFSQPLKPSENPVSPMCCCYYSFTERSFYKFINIWDVFFGIFGLFAGNIPQIILNVCFLIVVIICLVKFCQNGNYGTGLHKAYAIIRLVFVFLQLVFIIVTSILIILALTQINEKHQAYGPFIVHLVISCGILLPITIVSIQWSFLLKNTVNNFSEAGFGAGQQNMGQPNQYGNNNQYPQPGMNSGFNPSDSNYVN